MWGRRGRRVLRVPKTPEWQLTFVLPNLVLEEHHLSPSELTLGLDGIAIVSAKDPRVVEVMEWSEPASRFLNSFHDGNGVPITPAVLIVRNDWNSDMNKNAEPVIAFRNAVALTSILLARTRWPDGAWLGSSWSDTFDYHPAELRLDGSKWDLQTPALNSIGFRLAGLSLTPDIGLPRNNLGPIDKHLAARLGRVWHRRYRQGRDKRKMTRVFRSLESAFEALAMRFRTYSSLSEVGLGTVPWTTAVEVLASSGHENVTKWDCIDLIGNSPRSHMRELQRCRYWTKHNRRRRHITLSQRIFLHIYNARSKFVHGDKVSSKLLLPFGKEAPPLLSLASTVYRIALVSYLEKHWPMPKDGRLAFLIQETPYDDHLLKAINGTAAV